MNGITIGSYRLKDLFSLNLDTKQQKTNVKEIKIYGIASNRDSEMKRTKQQNNPELDFDQSQLPARGEFPLNNRRAGNTVRDVLRPDILAEADDFLIITGYTSLIEIISTFGTAEYDGRAQIRIVFGVEPQASSRTKWKRALLQEDIENYWWKRGISPFKCGMVLALVQHIRAQRVHFKILDDLHAKIYVSKDVAVMGSSNFSQNGLTKLHEANIRVRADATGSQPHQQTALKAIAEHFYGLAMPANNKIISLLEHLLQVVSWDEALARAIVAVLEGNFLEAYPALRHNLNEMELWPSQMQGVYQGLNILQNHGSILIADPTGSGKTKMICAIQMALVHWLWETGQQDRSSSLSITPPAVIPTWDKTQNTAGRILRCPVSHGVLSRKDSSNYKQTVNLLKHARILVVDEAHNYLNSASERSQTLAEHEASFTLLATATPINKKAEDLLRLIELLDPDNLGTLELEHFKLLYENKVSADDSSDPEGALQALRSYIWQFTLRRTKHEINQLIAKDPGAYRNQLKERCRYPEVTNKEYPMNESDRDVEAARKILSVASKLKGLIFLKTLKPPVWKKLDTLEAKQAYVKGRLRAANALAQYRVQAMLRSSRAALHEHILGTQAANRRFGLNTPKNTETGDVIGKLEKRSAPEQGVPIQTTLEKNALPIWLSDWISFKKACEEEIALYYKMIEYLEEISDGRERVKADHLVKCLNKHDLVVAFDHTIISLHQIAQLLKQEDVSYCLATAEQSQSNLQQTLEEFSLLSKKKSKIALCSDAMSEGVNMQKASAVVMLDMPSILRLAEQRIGRIDRLDSPHKYIEVHWPIDHEVFALRGDRHLFRTTHLTRRLLGSNLTLPEEFNRRFEELKAMTTAEIRSAVEQARAEDDGTWEGVQDAFSEIRALKEGSRALIKEELYKEMCRVKGSVRCRLSFVDAQSPWAFIATLGTERRPPRWIFIDDAGTLQTQFSEIAHLLRKRLEGVQKTNFAQGTLDHFLNIYKDCERELLPHKKRRAIRAAEHLLERQLVFEQKANNKETVVLLNEVQRLFRRGVTLEEAILDYHAFAQQWLDLLLPKLRERRAQLRSKRKRQYFGLDDFLKSKRPEMHFNNTELKHILDNVPLTEPLDQQIAACIIGVPCTHDTITSEPI